MSHKHVGMAAVAAGFLAFFLAVPPLTVRTPVVPIVLGLIGLGLGTWAVAA